jgi:hypothetical protein
MAPESQIREALGQGARQPFKVVVSSSLVEGE